MTVIEEEEKVKTRPKWWYVFIADIRVRVSRFRFLKGFRYFLPFLILVLFIIQFLLTVLTPTSELLIPNFEELANEWLFKIETCITSFIIFMAFNSSLSYFAQNTELAELELISGSPISTRSYLFGKFMSLQLNNIILVPVLLLFHVEFAKLGGATINWLFMLIFFALVSALFFSISWLGITLGPRTVFRMKNLQEGKKERRQWQMIVINLIVAFQFFVPFVLAIFLSAETFETVFTYLPQGWFAIVANEIFFSEFSLLPILFALLALLFCTIFIFLAYLRTNFTLNIENFESLAGTSQSKTKTPKVLKFIDKLPLPFKYSVKAFYLLNYRKSSFNRLLEFFFVFVAIGVIILGFIFPEWNWSNYVFAGSLIAGVFLTFLASTDGLQILFGGKNTFLVCQSAPKGVKKLLWGKLIQLLFTYFIHFISILTVLLIFYENKLIAVIVWLVIMSAVFNGLTTGLFSLSISPFFENADITSNPIRGLQIALPLNINALLTGGVVAILIYLLNVNLLWLFFLILFFYFIATGFLYRFIAEKLLDRFQP